MDKKLISIIAVAQTPPPFHGQAVMNQHLLEGEYSEIQFHHVRMAFSDDIQEVGTFRWKKILHLVQVFFHTVIMRFRTGSQILYYPPASPNMVPFLRDCVLLIGTRWLGESGLRAKWRKPGIVMLHRFRRLMHRAYEPFSVSLVYHAPEGRRQWQGRLPGTWPKSD
jgi:hypothetical protein